ncbi:hypothetical protein EDI_076920 [Entamoeba dispar SAW760]|uniref:Uncharacterized protein n=1 Tax=Entamoeba dispar (strain ATCC PRA-260 / SAW760) TaxID=370354 RepID=B0EIU1_ENTDS|nr:uncharacterized protein EDI_076920 [Entamoeba dispar SAW760]EDR25543.1 hypothetical protein EDI_076920 [Entamoeba dispar SAW760]|eukprot:EDR25543.1 hypothetical protein EDI_076920 [Entamoeba dispar SAW760]
MSQQNTNSCWLIHLKQNSDLEEVKKQIPQFILFTTPKNCREVSQDEFSFCGKDIPIYHMYTFEDQFIIPNLNIAQEYMTIMYFKNGKCLIQGESFVEFNNKMKKAIKTNDFSEGINKTQWLKTDTENYMKKLHHTVNRIKLSNEEIIDDRIIDWMDGL